MPNYGANSGSGVAEVDHRNHIGGKKKEATDAVVDDAAGALLVLVRAVVVFVQCFCELKCAWTSVDRI
jgi:hypothetical protein